MALGTAYNSILSGITSKSIFKFPPIWQEGWSRPVEELANFCAPGVMTSERIHTLSQNFDQVFQELTFQAVQSKGGHLTCQWISVAPQNLDERGLGTTC